MTRTRACVLLMLLLALSAAYADWRVVVLSDQLGGDHVQLVEACNRLQILRIEDNVSHYADWKVYGVVLAEQRVLPRTPARELFTAQLGQATRSKTWTPRTDCAQAIDTYGVRYKPPPPIAFSKRLPPESALTLSPADFQ